MTRESIAKAKAKTRERAIASGHDLHLVHQGGAHTRWVCLSCRQHFIIEEFHPPERPGYWDDNKWEPCPTPAQIPHLFCEDWDCHKFGRGERWAIAQPSPNL